MAFRNNGLTAPCDLGFFERLHYYYGKLMTVADFEAEQSYFNEKRWLLNRLTMGWGVVCGLKVERNPNCLNEVIVHPGLALDQYGNEIFVCRPYTISLAPPIPESAAENGLHPLARIFYLSIKFATCPVDPTPVPMEECGALRTECEYNRIREHFQIEAIAPESELFEKIRSQCERSDNPGEAPAFDCVQYLEKPCRTITSPCEPRERDGWLVLAKVTVHNHLVQEHIDNCTHRRLVFSNHRLAQTDDCLKKELWRVRTSRVDRRQFVPLLAQTIKGVQYQDGRNLIITDYWQSNDVAPGKVKRDVGRRPYDITTDGDSIWFTDLESPDNKSVVKMDRAGRHAQKLAVGRKSWGLAFDGDYMWATHPEDDAVSRIPISATDLVLLPAPLVLPGSGTNRLEPKAIVYAGGHMWVACNQGVMKIGARTQQAQFLDLGFTPKSMAFDGAYLWMTVDEGAEWSLRKIDLAGRLMLTLNPSKGECPESIAFDGVYMWVTHSEGATKYDVNKNKEEGDAVEDTALTGAAFDGAYLWTAGPASKKLHRIDVLTPEQVDQFRPDENDTRLQGNRHYAKICFDGTHLWVTDFVESRIEEERSHPGVVTKIGVVYRILI